MKGKVKLKMLSLSSKSFRKLNRRMNKKGFNLMELLIVVAIIAILVVVGLLAGIPLINRSRQSSTQMVMTNMDTGIDQCVRENPQFAKEAATNAATAITKLNGYLDANAQIGTPDANNDCTSQLKDSWGNPLILYINPGYHTTTGHGVGDGTDSEVVLVFKSYGMNGATASTANNADSDDLCYIVDILNGNVTRATVGFQTNMGTLENGTAAKEVDWFIK